MSFLYKKLVPLVISFILVATVAVFVLRTADDVIDEPKEADVPEEDLLAHSVEIWHFDPSGRKQWEVVADSVAVGKETVYRGISEGRIYTEDGTLVFQADEVVVDESTGDLRISGNVIVVDDNGAKLQTDAITYVAADGIIYCPEQVFVESDRATVSAGCMVWDIETGVVEMSGTVEVVLESGGTVEAESLVHNTKDGSSSMSNFRYIGIDR